MSWLQSCMVVCVVAGIAILVHELGHYLAAKTVGLQPERFEIGSGPVIYKRDIYAVKLAIPAGGRVSYSDDDWERLPPRCRKWVALGGPAMSIVTGLIAIPFFPLCGFLSLFCGFGNLIPFPVGKGYSDGGFAFEGVSVAQVWTARLVFGILALAALEGFFLSLSVRSLNPA